MAFYAVKLNWTPLGITLNPASFSPDFLSVVQILVGDFPSHECELDWCDRLLSCLAVQSSLRGWERSADPRGRVYWGLRGVVPVSPRVTRRSPPFPVLSIISTSPQHLDSHRCCGLSSVWPRIPDGQRAFAWGSCGLRKVRAYRQQWLSFYLGVVLPARGAPPSPAP